MTIEIIGTVKTKGEQKQITDNLSLQDFVVTIDETTQYPQHIVIEATNQKIELLNSIQIGDKVTVHVNLRGKESKGRYFNQLVLWKITK